MPRRRYLLLALMLGAVMALAQVPIAPSSAWRFGDVCVAAVFAMFAWYGYRTGKDRRPAQ
jgi:hypothetical protein